MPSQNDAYNLIHTYQWVGFGDIDIAPSGQGATLTYSFPVSAAEFGQDYTPERFGFSSLNTTQQGIALGALQTLANVADITLVPVSTGGNFRFSFTTTGSTPFSPAGSGVTTIAYATYPGPGVLQSGDIWINGYLKSDPNYFGGNPQPGSSALEVLIHELGHALGLEHPFTDSGNTMASDAATTKYTVMAYSDYPGHYNPVSKSFNGGSASFLPTTPMLLDIFALQAMYGRNMSYHAGNDTYVFTQGTGYYQTIWDAGGVDTIRWSGTSGVEIDLREGEFSQLGNPITFGGSAPTQLDTVAIAYGVSIENATGGSGNDTILGNNGSNILDGGAGSDAMTGFGGNDTYIVDSTADTITEAAAGGSDSVQSSATFTLSANVENLTLTGGAAVNGTGNTLGNVIIGNNNVNILTGLGGNDTLVGGAGDDVYNVEDSGDVAVEDANQGVDTLVTPLTWFLGANFENLTLTGSNHVNGIGNALGNTLTGNSGNNILVGMGGDDVYDMTAGGADIAQESANEGTDRVISTISFFLGSNVENLTLAGSANVNGTGNELANVFVGNAGANVFTGLAGNDTYFLETGDSAVESAAGGTDTVISSTGQTLGANVENLTLTGTGNGTGNALDNVLTATNGTANVLTGGLGNDSYVVDAGDTVVENGAANEGTDSVISSATFTLGTFVENLTLSGSATINGTGNASDNHLAGNAAANTLTGLGGNDTLVGGAGGDTMVGGTGDDSYSVDSAADVITENAGEGTDSVASTVTIVLAANVENIALIGAGINATGNALANILTTGSGSNLLAGLAGNDTYSVTNGSTTVVENANEGTDTVNASITFVLGANIENLTLTGSGDINGTGNALDNVLTGSAGTNVLAGLGGNDSYVIANATDAIVEASGGGTDSVLSSVTYVLSDNVENLALSGSGDLNATGNALANVLTGNAGHNVLAGLAGNDTMVGGAGNDTYVVDSAADVVTENAAEGTDGVQASVTFVLSANVENLTLVGGALINATGNALDNLIIGNSNANFLAGQGGNDTMIGGAGDDTYLVDSTGDIAAEGVDGGFDSVQSSVSYGLAANLEFLFLVGNTATNAFGNELNNIVAGNSADNSVDGGAGADTMSGGAGNDSFVVDNAGDTVSENLNEGTDSVNASVTFVLSANVENLTLTGTGNLNATGNSLANTLTGNAGNNVIAGQGGNDSMTGLAGNDLYLVDAAGDVVVEALNGGDDEVQSSATYALAANVERLTLTGVLAINGTGNALDNILTGNSAINTLTGGAGNDSYVVQNSGDVVVESANEGTDSVAASVTFVLGANVENLSLTGASGINGTGNALDNLMFGNDGANVLGGGAGNDTYFVGAGDSVVEGVGGGTVDTVHSTVTFALSAEIEQLVLIGAGNLNGTGNASANSIFGNESANVLSGLAGNDLLVGHSGDDTLIGNEGTDTLAGEEGADVLTGGAGADTLSGGNGNDVVVGGGSVSSIVIDTNGLLAGNLGQTWTAVGIQDTNGDSRGDILWSQSGGTSAIWTVSGLAVGAGSGVVTNSSGAPSALGADWTPTGFDDFNGDAKGDVLWSRASTGQAVIIQLDGTVIQAAALLNGAIGANWGVKGTGDFDADGKADILWSRTNGGGTISVAIWNMDGFTIKGGSANFGSNPATGFIGSSYQISGIGDLNGDGRDDIVWRNATNGENQVWMVNGATSFTPAVLPARTGAAWVLRGVEDFNGDGKDDLLWQDTASSTSNVEVWTMDGATRSSTTVYSTNAAGWTVAGLADGTGDGITDIYWTFVNGPNAPSRNVQIWEMGAADDVLTGGNGRDLFHFEGRTDVGARVSDFQAGAGGDMLGLSAVMSDMGMAGTNGLSAGVVRAFQNGTSTEVQLDTRPGAGTHWVSLATLQNTNAASLGADNWVF